REIVIDFRKLLFLERREGQLVVDRLAAELLVGEILGEGLAKPPSLSGQRSAERLVDLRHRVGMPDLECQLLVAERARILTGLQDLDETALDVRHREIPWSRGPSLDRMELGVPFSKTIDQAVDFLRCRLHGDVRDRNVAPL